jgi:hypothetical protein
MPHAVLALFLGLTLAVAGLPVAPAHAAGDPRYYDVGSPVLTDLWVDPVNGSDGNSGATRAAALRTVTAAWTLIPLGVPLATTGVRIMLVAGTYAPADTPNFWESRYGTFQFPIVIESSDGVGSASLPSMNVFDVRFLYLIGLEIRATGGDVLHCERCDHLLVRQTRVLGAPPASMTVQETLKVNQSQNVFIEDSDVSGAFDNAIDFVAVQGGHVQGNRIHDAADWCIYLKGGSAYLRVEGVRLPDGRFLSLTAQGGVVPEIVPIASRFIPFPLTAEVARYTFGAADPPGDYTWFAALTEPGTATVVGAIDMDPFTLAP